MTRIVAGRFGGRRLAVPPSGTRPTSERAREGIFSTLTSLLGGFDGVRFLDLYAGSGAIVLEAWSRGAAQVTLVEAASRAVAVLRANVVALTPVTGEPGALGAVNVVAAKVESALATMAVSSFDVVFADPPYDVSSAGLSAVVGTLCGRRMLANGAIVAVERAVRDQWSWPEGIEPLSDRRYGDARVWYGRAARVVDDTAAVPGSDG